MSSGRVRAPGFVARGSVEGYVAIAEATLVRLGSGELVAEGGLCGGRCFATSGGVEGIELGGGCCRCERKGTDSMLLTRFTPRETCDA